jgi:hypothetical protein
MADFIRGSETRTQGEVIDRVFFGGEEAEFIFGHGTQIFPNLPVPIYGMTRTRIVDDAGQRWFEIGFRMDHPLTGNPAAGWRDQGDYFRIDYEWSPDLVNWSAGKFFGAPVPIVDMGDGSFEYWARAIHPVDSAVKTGVIRASSGYPQEVGDVMTPDTRNHPFTSLTLAGVVQPLGGYPYTMPGDAARMQADILARGWTGATVEASSSTVWRIIIPTVNFTSYSQSSKLFWPAYLVPDIFGNLTNQVDGASFAGTFVNAAGTPIFTRAFGRLKISGGSRYSLFHTP